MVLFYPVNIDTFVLLIDRYSTKRIKSWDNLTFYIMANLTLDINAFKFSSLLHFFADVSGYNTKSNPFKTNFHTLFSPFTFI